MFVYRWGLDEWVFSALTAVRSPRHSGGGVTRESPSATRVVSTSNFIMYEKTFWESIEDILTMYSLLNLVGKQLVNYCI